MVNKTKVNRVLKFLNDMVTYKTVLIVPAMLVTGAVAVFGVTPVTLLMAAVTPVASGYAAFKLDLQ